MGEAYMFEHQKGRPMRLVADTGRGGQEGTVEEDEALVPWWAKTITNHGRGHGSMAYQDDAVHGSRGQLDDLG